MATLHTVNKSPFQTQTLISCLGHAKAGDSVLMIEDGVYGAMSGSSMSEVVAGMGANVKLFVLEADLAARGIEAARIAEGVTSVGYDEFVDMAASCDRVQNWL
jgi:tRNA 2-thiouridine synthesizing protein B